MKIRSRQELLLLIAGLTIAVLACDRLVITPLMRTWKERAAQIKLLEGSISKGQSLRDRDSALRERWEAMRTNSLPSDASTAENALLQAFERWARESRISVTSIKPQWKRGTENYLELECQADASGTMETLSRFLHHVEKDPMAVKIKELTIASRDKDGQQLNLALQVSGLVLNTPPVP